MFLQYTPEEQQQRSNNNNNNNNNNKNIYEGKREEHTQDEKMVL